MGATIMGVGKNGRSLVDATSRETEHHFHTRGTGVKFFGDNAGTPTQDFSTPFTLTCGNDDFGTEVLMLDAGTTPVDSGMTNYDPGIMTVTQANSVGIWFVKFYCGSSTFGASDVLTTSMLVIDSVAGFRPGNEVEIYAHRCTCGTDKIWATAKLAGGNAKTLDLYLGIHEYLE